MPVQYQQFVMAYVVKSRRTGQIVYGTPTLSESNAIAHELNTAYQTDEYRSEQYVPHEKEIAS